MPSLEETMNKLLDLFKEIANAIREKRHYDWELLIEEMPEEIRKIGIYKDWYKESAWADAGSGEGNWSTSIITDEVDFAYDNRLAFVTYQDDGDSDYPHHPKSYPIPQQEDIAVFGTGDDAFRLQVTRTKGTDSWFIKTDPVIDIDIFTVADWQADDAIAWVNYFARFESGADWIAKFIVGGRDPID